MPPVSPEAPVTSVVTVATVAPTGCEPPAVKKVVLASQTLESRVAMFGWKHVKGATSYTVQVIEINPLNPGSWRLKTLSAG